MKAIRLHGKSSPDHLVYEEAPRPRPEEGEVLVQVHATGLTPMELTWGIERSLMIPGHELSGVVAEVGSGITDVMVGSAVYALMDFRRDGAEAEYAIALPGELAPKPRSLDHVQAAAVPLAALTAWQAFFVHAGLAAGQRVLVHGAAGGVGVFAVQLAHWAGAYVIGTASARNKEFLYGLGADEVIDYTTTRFEEVIHDVDVVLDTIGGETQERSWGVLRKGGMLVAIAGDIVDAPLQELAASRGARAKWFIVEPNRDQLIRIGDLIDAGRVRSVVEAVFPLSEARRAFEQGLQGHTRGKIVLRVID